MDIAATEKVHPLVLLTSTPMSANLRKELIMTDDLGRD